LEEKLLFFKWDDNEDPVATFVATLVKELDTAGLDEGLFSEAE